MKSDLYLKWDLYSENDIAYSRFVRKTGLNGIAVFLYSAIVLTLNDGNSIADDDFVYQVASKLHCSDKLVKPIVEIALEEGLLKEDENGIFSARVRRDVELNKAIGEKRKAAIQNRWNKSNSSEIQKKYNCITNEIQKNNKCNTNELQLKYYQEQEQEQEQNKEKESKDSTKKNFQKPSLEELESYAKEIGIPDEASAFFDFYESKGWKVGKETMKNWKAALRNWKRHSSTRKTIVDVEERNRFVNADGSLNLRG